MVDPATIAIGSGVLSAGVIVGGMVHKWIKSHSHGDVEVDIDDEKFVIRSTDTPKEVQDRFDSVVRRHVGADF